MKTIFAKLKSLSPEKVFMISAFLVNGGNYIYNLLLGRILGPKEFADAAILITFLLVLSFIAMTFQLVTTKFSVLFSGVEFKNFIGLMTKYSVYIGLLIGVLVIVFSKSLQSIFNTSTSNMFVFFGIGIPIYFLMSINRGVFQGEKEFKKLSVTYQGEMLSRLIITLLLLYFFSIQSSLLVAIGILISFVFALYPFRITEISFKGSYVLEDESKKQVYRFFALTAFYELTQIIINNSDILLVKHYFDNYEAGLYASLALIGRVVYFVAWMFVMLLLPTVVKMQKDGEAHAPELFKYVGYIALLSFIIVLGSYLFPELVVTLMFGDQYISIAPLLWKYALATSIFAISNIFAYYFLSLDKYIPVIISAVLGVAQVGLIIYFHDSLLQVVVMQIIAMSILLVVQLLFFGGYLLSNRKATKQ